MGKQRDLTLDIIKAIGIIFMVAGHCYWPFKHFIYLFHMAIFFIASGYCYKENCATDLNSVVVFIKRKIKTLWVPFVLWMTIFSVLHNFFIKVNIYTDNPLIKEYVSGPYIGTTSIWSIADIIKNIVKAMFLHGRSQLGGAFWFLATLMEISITYCFVNYLLNKLLKHNTNKVFVAQWIVSSLLLMAGYSCYKINRSFFGLDRVLSYYVLFHGGYTLRKYGVSNRERDKTIHFVIMMLTFLVLCISNRFGTIALDRNSYENPVFFMMVSFAGWQFLYEISYFLSETGKCKYVLALIGQNTLAVVILHFLCFKIVNYVGVILYNSPIFLVAAFPVLYMDGAWWILYTVVGLTIPVLLSLAWKRMKCSLKANINICFSILRC